MAPFQAFRCRDGWIYVAVWVERLWRPFCEALDRPDLADDPRFATAAGRVRHRTALAAVLDGIFASGTVAEWMARLEARDVLCAPVNRYRDLPADPQVAASGMLVEQDDPRAGRIRTLATPVRFSRTPGTRRTPAPALGEHTDAVLAEAGFDAGEIARLRAAAVVR
jgi:formyl-CoA transferase/CoA:oxalate CoA-transferase